MNAIPAAAAEPVRKLPGKVQNIGRAAITPKVLIEMPTMAPESVGIAAAINRPIAPSEQLAATWMERFGLFIRQCAPSDHSYNRDTVRDHRHQPDVECAQPVPFENLREPNSNAV